MAERKRIALIFKVDKAWMGGTYYVLNLIHALNSLPDDEKPEILLLCKNDDDFNYALEYSKYPLLHKRILKGSRVSNLLKRIINKLSRSCLKRNILAHSRFKEKVDAIYPVMNRFQIASLSPRLYWIPDFQEHFLPHLFTDEKIAFRDRMVKEIIEAGGDIVFSSYDAQENFFHFYPEGLKCKTHVLHFTSKISPIGNDNEFEILHEYNAPDKFFYCSNQFWTHKNHLTLFKAIKLLKDNGKEIVVYCSGGTDDYRNPDYYPSLLRFIEDNNLGDNIKMLGFIERSHQVALMNKCLAIIQPSLFEGWNTGVEEAKSLNKFLILSDLPVHREQVKENVMFFQRESAADLAQTIGYVYDNTPDTVSLNYDESIRVEGRTFMEIIDNMSIRH